MDVREALFYKKVIGGGGVPQQKIDDIARTIGIETPSTPFSILYALDEIIGDANQTTGNSDEFVIDAVHSLIDGYGGGGGGVPSVSNGVNFIDYDGTIVEVWQSESVATKTALPENPTHDGLTAQGWNWSLEDIQSYIANYPDAVVTVGQMYITDDGKTRIYIHLEEGRLSPWLGICPNGSVDIDWGDGTSHDTVTGTNTSTVKSTQHIYASGGDYVINLTVSGSMGIVGDSSVGSKLLWQNASSSYNRIYQNAVKKVEIGNSGTSIGDYAFVYCHSLASVAIPNGVTSIGSHAFSYCYALANVTIPNGVTSIDKYTFSSCCSLVNVAIPNSMTNIDNHAFSSCYTLASVAIPNSVTSIGDTTFQSCFSLANVTIPNSVTSIGSDTFSSCCSLVNVVIPNGVTSIGDSAFSSCYTLANVVIPNGVTSINNRAFAYCYGLGFVKFTSQTPPIVSNINAWSNIPNDCIIYVPSGTIATYQLATNYPSQSTYTYVEY